MKNIGIFGFCQFYITLIFLIFPTYSNAQDSKHDYWIWQKVSDGQLSCESRSGSLDDISKGLNRSSLGPCNLMHNENSYLEGYAFLCSGHKAIIVIHGKENCEYRVSAMHTNTNPGFPIDHDKFVPKLVPYPGSYRSGFNRCLEEQFANIKQIGLQVANDYCECIAAEAGKSKESQDLKSLSKKCKLYDSSESSGSKLGG